jgi:hypothetical protein
MQITSFFLIEITFKGRLDKFFAEKNIVYFHSNLRQHGAGGIGFGPGHGGLVLDLS